MNDDIRSTAELVRKLALMADTLVQRAHQYDHRQQQTMQSLQQTLAEVRNDVDRLMHAAEQRAIQAVRQSMAEAMEPTVTQSDQVMRALSAGAEHASQTLNHAIQSVIAKLQRHIVNSYAAIVGAMLLLILGSSLLLWYQHQSYEDALVRTETANVSADTSELYAKVGIASCAGQPCLKLDTKSPRWGNHGEYVLLESGAKH